MGGPLTLVRSGRWQVTQWSRCRPRTSRYVNPFNAPQPSAEIPLPPNSTPKSHLGFNSTSTAKQPDQRQPDVLILHRLDSIEHSTRIQSYNHLLSAHGRRLIRYFIHFDRMISSTRFFLKHFMFMYPFAHPRSGEGDAANSNFAPSGPEQGYRTCGVVLSYSRHSHSVPMNAQ